MITRQAEVGWLEIIAYGATAKNIGPNAGPGLSYLQATTPGYKFT